MLHECWRVWHELRPGRWWVRPFVQVQGGSEKEGTGVVCMCEYEYKEAQRKKVPVDVYEHREARKWGN